MSLLPDYKDRDAGYRLVLHRVVEVPPQRARVFIQGGKLLGSGFDSYEVSCNLEVRHLSDQVQRIEPDTFVVNVVQAFFEEVASCSGWKAQMLAGAAVDASPSNIFRGWHFWLHSPRQPDVIRLTCRGVFAEPWEAVPPSFDEIAQALGDIATLELVGRDLQPGAF